MERRSPLINPRYSVTIFKSLGILHMTANSNKDKSKGKEKVDAVQEE